MTGKVNCKPRGVGCICVGTYQGRSQNCGRRKRSSYWLFVLRWPTPIQKATNRVVVNDGLLRKWRGRWESSSGCTTRIKWTKDTRPPRRNYEITAPNLHVHFPSTPAVIFMERFGWRAAWTHEIDRPVHVWGVFLGRYKYLRDVVNETLPSSVSYVMLEVLLENARSSSDTSRHRRQTSSSRGIRRRRQKSNVYALPIC